MVASVTVPSDQRGQNDPRFQNHSIIIVIDRRLLTDVANSFRRSACRSSFVIYDICYDKLTLSNLINTIKGTTKKVLKKGARRPSVNGQPPIFLFVGSTIVKVSPKGKFLFL